MIVSSEIAKGPPGSFAGRDAYLSSCVRGPDGGPGSRASPSPSLHLADPVAYRRGSNCRVSCSAQTSHVRYSATPQVIHGRCRYGNPCKSSLSWRLQGGLRPPWRSAWSCPCSQNCGNYGIPLSPCAALISIRPWPDRGVSAKIFPGCRWYAGNAGTTHWWR